MNITDQDRGHVVSVEDSALIVKGIQDLIATLEHCGAYNDAHLRMKDKDTGNVFSVSILLNKQAQE